MSSAARAEPIWANTSQRGVLSSNAGAFESATPLTLVPTIFLIKCYFSVSLFCPSCSFLFLLPRLLFFRQNPISFPLILSLLFLLFPSDQEREIRWRLRRCGRQRRLVVIGKLGSSGDDAGKKQTGAAVWAHGGAVVRNDVDWSLRSTASV